MCNTILFAGAPQNLFENVSQKELPVFALSCWRFRSYFIQEKRCDWHHSPHCKHAVSRMCLRHLVQVRLKISPCFRFHNEPEVTMSHSLRVPPDFPKELPLIQCMLPFFLTNDPVFGILLCACRWFCFLYKQGNGDHPRDHNRRHYGMQAPSVQFSFLYLRKALTIHVFAKSISPFL